MGGAELPGYCKAKARAAGHGDAADRFEAARVRHYNRTREARERAVEEYRLRVYKEGLERLRRELLTRAGWQHNAEGVRVRLGPDTAGAYCLQRHVDGRARHVLRLDVRLGRRCR